MKRIIYLKPVLIYGSSLILIALLFAFISHKQDARMCSKIHVKIEQKPGIYFIAEPEVIDYLSLGGSEQMTGKLRPEFDLRKLERRLTKSPFIEESHVSIDLAGNLVIEVSQPEPLVRFVEPNGSQGYLSEKGEKLPLSARYTPRVPVFFGTLRWDKNDYLYISDSVFEELIQMLIFIKKDKFWNAQIAEIEMDKQKNLTLIPQVTGQTIEFGTALDFEDKFKRLRVFYKQILPQKGWNAYQKVNVKFKDQIICN